MTGRGLDFNRGVLITDREEEQFISYSLYRERPLLKLFAAVSKSTKLKEIIMFVLLKQNISQISDIDKLNGGGGLQ